MYQFKPSELRVGSLVNYLLVDPEDQLCKIDWQDLGLLNDYPATFNKSHQPIPITEEWLIRLGFTNENYGWGKGEFGLFDYGHGTGDLNLRLNADHCPLPYITTVHQLQNLYFALTNQELIIKQESNDNHRKDHLQR